MTNSVVIQPIRAFTRAISDRAKVSGLSVINRSRSSGYLFIRTQKEDGTHCAHDRSADSSTGVKSYILYKEKTARMAVSTVD